MLVKEISFTLPVMIALFELFLFQGQFRKRVIMLIPFAFTMLVIPSMLLIAEGDFSIEDIDDSMNTLASYPDMPRTDYLFTQFRVIVTYLRLLVLPVNQNLDYDYSVYHSFFSPPVLFSFLFLLLIFSMGIYLLYRSVKKKQEGWSYERLVSLGIFWFFITLSVESSIIPIKDIIFEHRLYLPSVGFIMTLTGLALMGVGRIRTDAGLKTLMVITSCVLCILGISTYARNKVWKTNISVWEDVVKKSPLKARPHNNLGVAYETEDRIDDAISEYLLAIQIDPMYEEAHYNLGMAYDEKDRGEDAVNELLTAIEIRPAYGQAYNNLGIIYGSMGRTEDAIRQFLKVKKINPNSVKAHNNLGIMYARQGRIEDAIAEFLSALDLNPDYVEAHYNLGITYKKLGRFEEAVEKFQTVLRLDPRHKGAKKNVNNILRMKKRKKGL